MEEVVAPTSPSVSDADSRRNKCAFVPNSKVFEEIASRQTTVGKKNGQKKINNKSPPILRIVTSRAIGCDQIRAVVNNPRCPCKDHGPQSRPVSRKPRLKFANVALLTP